MTRIIKAVRNNTKYTSTRAKYEIEIGNILQNEIIQNTLAQEQNMKLELVTYYRTK
jgi:hypothetical protein